MAVALSQEPLKIAIHARTVLNKPLGRHVHHDPRSWHYPAERAAAPESTRHTASGLPLIQDDAHICSTAHALCGALNCGPSGLHQAPWSEADAVSIYTVASRTVPVTDRGRPIPGSSGLAACKAAKALGLIRSYEHAFGIDHAVAALTLRPVMSGFNWYTSFDWPDPETGLVEIADDAVVRGGHEVVADELDLEAGLVWFWNSWGPEYGIGGRFCMSIETWDRLLRDRGDVTVPRHHSAHSNALAERDRL